MQKVAWRWYSFFSFMALSLVGIVMYAALADSAPVRTPNVALTASVATASDAPIEPDIEARSAIVYDALQDKVLFSKNSDEQIPLASITKIMLALVAYEVLEPNTFITITPASIMREGDDGFESGQVVRMQDLLDFTLVASSNDGADALARAAAPRILEAYPAASVDSPTVWRMNELAKEIGMLQTFFTDPTGLDISINTASNYGSARDVAQMMLYALIRQPTAITETARDSALIESPVGATQTAANTNKALGEVAGLIAGKTGFTDLAGGNLAIIFDASIGRPIVVVVLGSSKEGRFEDVKNLVAIARTRTAK